MKITRLQRQFDLPSKFLFITVVEACFSSEFNYSFAVYLFTARDLCYTRSREYELYAGQTIK